MNIYNIISPARPQISSVNINDQGPILTGFRGNIRTSNEVMDLAPEAFTSVDRSHIVQRIGAWFFFHQLLKSLPLPHPANPELYPWDVYL